jgi:hypothetical protein
MQSWHDLVKQILIGVVVNSILAIPGWLGKRYITFLKKLNGFSMSSENFKTASRHIPSSQKISSLSIMRLQYQNRNFSFKNRSLLLLMFFS